MNKSEAVERFMGEFNLIPLSLVEKAYNNLYEYIIPPVEPTPEDFGLDSDEEPIFSDGDDKNDYEELYKRWKEYQEAHEQWEYDCEDYYPMWGTLFECDSWDSKFILNHIKEVQDIGFIIIDGLEELNVCLGVKGAGYSFKDAHFEPLYDLLGLKWHTNAS